MGKFSSILVLIGVGIIAAFFLYLAFPKNETNPGRWPRVTWEQYQFPYPPSDDWKIEPVTYATPAMQASGTEPELVGYRLIYSGNKDAEAALQTIEIGGRQNECTSMKDYATRCTQNPLPIIFTTSTDQEVLRIYDQIVESATPI